MHFTFYWICVAVLLCLSADVQGSRSKRVLPTNQNCDPDNGVCRKGDWVAESIADCYSTSSSLITFLNSDYCEAQNDAFLHWTVDVAEDNGCAPTSGKRFTCGSAGTNTRCVCSDTKTLFYHECRCQYWPEANAGADLPAFCTGYYIGGESGLHHWACCNNCKDPTNDCDGVTWHEGSSESYCASCGENTGGGRVKYYFNCGSCQEQRQCKDYCSGPIQNLPGLCWRWLDCFKGCCLAMTQQPSQSQQQIETMSFCGDGTCSSGESPTTCPIDCCYQKNPICAKNQTNLCNTQCCGDPSCCLEGSTASVTTSSVTYILLMAFFAKMLST